MFAAGWIALNHNLSLAGIHSKIIFVLPNHNMNCSLQMEDAGNDTSAVLFTICGEDTQTSLDMQKQETSPAIEQHRTLNRSRRHHLMTEAPEDKSNPSKKQTKHTTLTEGNAVDPPM